MRNFSWFIQSHVWILGNEQSEKINTIRVVGGSRVSVDSYIFGSNEQDKLGGVIAFHVGHRRHLLAVRLPSGDSEAASSFRPHRHHCAPCRLLFAGHSATQAGLQRSTAASQDEGRLMCAQRVAWAWRRCLSWGAEVGRTGIKCRHGFLHVCVCLSTSIWMLLRKLLASWKLAEETGMPTRRVEMDRVGLQARYGLGWRLGYPPSQCFLSFQNMSFILTLFKDNSSLNINDRVKPAVNT